MSQRRPGVPSAFDPHRGALLLCLALAGCNAPAPANRAVPQLDDGNALLEWQGTLACADCDAIDTRLVLRRAGGIADYNLTETYLDGDEATPFSDHGHWQRHAALLELQGDNGSRRVYALLPDGSLQPRDGHGNALAAREDDVLAPVVADDQ